MCQWGSARAPLGAVGAYENAARVGSGAVCGRTACPRSSLGKLPCLAGVIFALPRCNREGGFTLPCGDRTWHGAVPHI